MPRLLVIAAHPDDETIGAAALLTTFDRCAVVHLTDGVPRDRAFWPGRAPASAEGYAARRRAEALGALAIAGLSPADVHQLGFTDLELTASLPQLARALSRLLAALAPDMIVSHAYEGGHPDHDAAALATAAARELIVRGGAAAPLHIEMALYHGAPGAMVTGEFIASGAGSPPQIQCAFAGDSLRRKQDMLRCYRSQEEVLRPFFANTHERFRPAPRYDFTAPPHPGPLHYERNGMPMSGEEWRAHAAAALAELRVDGRAGAARRAPA